MNLSTKPLETGYPSSKFNNDWLNSSPHPQTSDKSYRLKRKQKKQFVGLGMKASQFELEFQQGYEEGRQSLEKATPAQRAKRCVQLQKMAKMK